VICPISVVLPAPFGPMLLLVVIYARGGIEGLLSGRRRG
jgi:hypothetical protein